MQAFIKGGVIMIDIELNITFYREVNFAKKFHEILNSIDGIQARYIAENERKEHIVILGYQIEDEKEIEAFMDKIAAIDGKKTFSMESREVKVNQMEGILDVFIPFIPSILKKLGNK
jgi:hypothetical protein